MKHYSLDAYGRSSDPIQDSVLGKVTETPERLSDHTNALAPAWWNSDETAKAVIIDWETKLPITKSKVDLIDDPEGKDRQLRQTTSELVMATTVKKLENVAATSREQKATWQKMTAEAKKKIETKEEAETKR